jgi:hypothetical protein
MSETNDPVEHSESLPVPGLPVDWHVLATEKVVSTVDTVRVKTAGPAIKISRMVVYGIMAAFIGLMAVILLLIGLVRLLDNVLPKDVWLVYLILGGLFMAIGAFLWSKRPRGAAS